MVERRRRRGQQPEPIEERAGGAVAGRGALAGVTLAAFALAAVAPWPVRRSPPLLDRTNNVLFQVAADDPAGGLLATGSEFSLMQLRTRRPVLLDSGALDTLTYAPESGPEMARILRDVYELDLLHPPKGVARGGAAIPAPYNKRVWEGFTGEKWREIRRTYHVSQVLTGADHELQLPVAAQFGSYRLYRIPD